MIMTAEEFINEVSRKYDCPLFRLHRPDVVTKENALRAVGVARKEERERAIMVLKFALDKYSYGLDIHCSTIDLIKRFSENL